MQALALIDFLFNKKKRFFEQYVLDVHNDTGTPALQTNSANFPNCKTNSHVYKRPWGFFIIKTDKTRQIVVFTSIQLDIDNRFTTWERKTECFFLFIPF